MPPAKQRGSLGAELKITGICSTGSARRIGNAQAAVTHTTCLWRGGSFIARRGGSPQRFCL
jgi:hypothetical protein